MRVLIVNTANSGYTGITSVIFRYAERTSPAVRYDFVLAGRVEPFIPARIAALGGQMFLPPASRLKNPLGYTRWLAGCIRAGRYDAVHVHGNSGTMFFDIHAAKRAGAPVRIAHCHSSSCKYVLAHRLLKGRLCREMTVGVACSDAAEAWLFSGRDGVVWLPNGIEPEPFRFSPAVRSETRAALGLSGCFVVGHVGHFEREKNHAFLLKAFSHLAAERADARLLLVGDGSLRPEIESAAASLGLSGRVVFTGRRADTAALYQAMDVFAMPSLYEGLPVTLIEAQAAGLPCIASDRITRQANAIGLVQYAGIGEADAGRFAALLNGAIRPDDARAASNAALAASPFAIGRCAAQLIRLYGGGLPN